MNRTLFELHLFFDDFVGSSSFPSVWSPGDDDTHPGFDPRWVYGMQLVRIGFYSVCIPRSCYSSFGG